MSWFQGIKNWFQGILLNFKRKWKSYTISLILAASIAANVAVWKKCADVAKEAKFSQATVKIIRNHGALLNKTEQEIDKIVKKAEFAKALAIHADAHLREGDISAAKEKLAEARKTLDKIPGILDKLKFKQLQAELAVIKARVQKEPGLATSLPGIEENEARLKNMIAWREKMLETTRVDMVQLEEKEVSID